MGSSNFGQRFVLMDQTGGEGGGGTGGGGTGGGGAPVFADANAASGFLKDYVHSPDFLKVLPQDQVVPFASHLKTKIDGYSNAFPEKWRNLVAGENADHLKTLERFQSPKALYESYSALRSKMASGELRSVTPYPDKGTPEDQSTWRTANGVPLDAAEYTKALKLPEGVQLGDDDKKTVESMAKAAHAANMNPAHFNATANWFLQEKNARAEARHEAEENRRMATEDALRAEWQNDYRGNIARIHSLFDAAPQGVKDLFLGARFADGSMMMNHPDTLKWLVDMSRQTNPAGVVLPGGGGTLSQSVEEELKSIDKVMRTDRAAYNKDEKMQERYRELIGAYQKMTGKQWGQA